MLINIGLLILRLTIGLLFAAHGSQKLFGWFGGEGFRKYSDGLQRMGFVPAGFWAMVNGLAEFLGGLLLVVGLLTPIAAAALVCVMVMAIVKVHGPKGFWNKNGGYEFPLTLLLMSVVLGLTGPGSIALAPRFEARLPELALFAISLLVGLIGVAVGLGISTRQVEHPRQTL